jgi:hypothetical protein
MVKDSIIEAVQRFRFATVERAVTLRRVSNATTARENQENKDFDFQKLEHQHIHHGGETQGKRQFVQRQQDIQ